MNLKELSDSVNGILLDEHLLRLLCYAPKSAIDDPLSPSKPDILTMKDQRAKWELIKYHLMNAVNFYDLDSNAISRLVFYPGNGKGAKQNYLFANQEYTFDIYTHYTNQNLDRRIELISDRINELICNKRIAGIGKTLFLARHPIVSTSLPNGYVGFRIIYEFCLENY